ncbi:MAG: GTPase domain-containing protein [Myxococcota bacterium]|jgi:signal recognition particle receptor subunit beta|nr:GTPase domain-containing protein [Myxococcota bacterium]
MPHIIFHDRELVFKLVYFGPGMSGKTTNLVYIHRSLANVNRGEMISLKTANERTLFFDFFPLEVGEIGGFKIRFNMYTVPGQVYYEASRRLILDGADGVVFVADSQPALWEENLQSYRGMQENLRSYGQNPDVFPTVIQYNKRDCEEPIALGSIERELGLGELPCFEAVATEGQGVMETIRTLSREIIHRFKF